MLTAFALVKTGVKVAIIEKSASALESSWAGGGILSPLYPWRYPDAVNVLSFKSQDLYPALADEVQQVSGIDPELYPCGMHVLEEDLDAAAYRWLLEHNVNYTDSAPKWNKDTSKKYLFFSQVAQIRNPRFIKSLGVTLARLGVEFSLNNTVSGFKKEASGGFSITTGKGQWVADKMVVCAGAWTSKLLESVLPSVAQPNDKSSTRFKLDISPVQGQMLLYKADKDLIPSIILAKGKYIIPRKDGRVLVGSTMENVGFNKAITENGLHELTRFVADISPVLLEYPIEKHWAGLRPGSPNGIPFIGEHPAISGLFINSGHFRNGVVMAPASASLMCSLIEGKQIDMDVGPYSIA